MQVESDIPTESTTTLKEETAREDFAAEKQMTSGKAVCSDPSRRRRRR